MNTFGDLNAVVAVVTMSLVLIGLVVALEHNHRRTAGLPRAPFGSDAEDADLARIRRDLAQARTVGPVQTVHELTAVHRPHHAHRRTAA